MEYTTDFIDNKKRKTFYQYLLPTQKEIVILPCFPISRKIGEHQFQTKYDMSYSFYFFLFLSLFLVFEGWIIKCIIDFRNQKVNTINTIKKTELAIVGGAILSIFPYIFILQNRGFNYLQYSRWSFCLYLYFAVAIALIYEQIWDRQATAIQNREPMGARRFSLALGWGFLNSFVFYLFGSSLLFQIGNSDFHSETAINCKIVEARESHSHHGTSYYYALKPINKTWEESLHPINKDSIGEMDLFSLDLTKKICVPVVHMVWFKKDAIEFKSDYENYKRQSKLIGDTIEVSFLKGYFGDIARGKNPLLTKE